MAYKILDLSAPILHSNLTSSSPQHTWYDLKLTHIYTLLSLQVLVHELAVLPFPPFYIWKHQPLGRNIISLLEPSLTAPARVMPHVGFSATLNYHILL
jgi:hypothetical protein